MNGSSLAGFLGTHLIDMHGQQVGVCGSRIGRGRRQRRRPDGLHLGDELLQFGVGRLSIEQVGLAGQSGGEFVSQLEPGGLGTRAEIAKRADDLLAGAFGSEGAFDQDVIEVGLAFG